MSLLLLIDGYNVVAPVASPGRRPDPNWLHRERMSLLDRLVGHLDEQTLQRTCVVFDAANPPADRPHQFSFHGMEIEFAVDYPEADDLLEELIASHSAPKTLAVVSSDHRVQTAAKRRGATCFESQSWLDDLLDGKVGLASQKVDGAGQGGPAGMEDEKPVPKNDDDDIEGWMREFGF